MGYIEENLMKDETVIFKTKKHWISYIWWGLVCCLICGGPIALVPAVIFLINGELMGSKIAELSEGQKGLVSFARLVLMKPGLLIFDEPTNHINFRHLPVIAKALDAYEGAMILVSHVPTFVEQIRIDEVLQMGK